MAGISNGRRCTRPLTGRVVLACLIAFFAVIAIANGIMIRAAVTTFGGVETSSSYQAGLAFARESAAAHAQDELRWQVQARVQPIGGRTSVDIDARDAAGRPLAGLQATARLSHPTDRRADQVVALSESASGHFRGMTAAIVGQWDVVIELSRDGERLFRSRNRVVVQ
jgi:nitrogen fixation protein FixH